MPVQILPAPPAALTQTPIGDNSRLAQLYAQLLLKGAMGNQPIQSHWQGVNQLVQGAMAGMAMGRERAQEQNRAQLLAELATGKPLGPAPQSSGGLGDVFSGIGKGLSGIFGGSAPASAAPSSPMPSSGGPSPQALAQVLSGGTSAPVMPNDPMGQPSWRDDAMVKYREPDDPMAQLGPQRQSAPPALIPAPTKVGPSAFDAPQGPMPTAPAVSDRPYGADSSTAVALRPSASIPQGSGPVADMIRSAAQAYGLDPATMVRIGQVESRLNPNSANPHSSARGVYQFMTGPGGSWDEYGGGANPLDPRANIDAGMRYTRDNVNHFKREMGREPTPGEMYLAHQQGRAGAVALLKHPDAPAVEALATAYGGNRNRALQAIVQNGGSPDMTAGQFAQRWTNRFADLGGGSPSPFDRIPASPSDTVNMLAAQGGVQGMPTPQSSPMQGQAIQAALASPGLRSAPPPPVPAPQRMAIQASPQGQQQPFQTASLGPVAAPGMPSQPRPAAAPQQQIAQAGQGAPQQSNPVRDAITSQLRRYESVLNDPRVRRDPKLLTDVANVIRGLREKLLTLEQYEPVRDRSGNIVAQRNILNNKMEKDPRAESTDDLREWQAENIARGARGLPPLSPMEYITSVKKAGAQNVTVNNTVNPVLKGVGEGFVEELGKAKGAARQVSTLHEARRQLDQGVITGAAADWRLQAQKIGALFGLSPEQATNTETFRSTMGAVVLDLVKGLGSGTAISNADREYAAKIAGGEIALEEKSIRRLLDIGEKAARARIKMVNEDADRLLKAQPDEFKSIAPLMKIEEPGEYKAPERSQAPQQQGQPMRARNPQTGEELILDPRTNQWVPAR